MCGYSSYAPASDLDDGHMPFISVIPRAIHRAGQVAFQGAAGPMYLLDVCTRSPVSSNSVSGMADFRTMRTDSFRKVETSYFGKQESSGDT